MTDEPNPEPEVEPEHVGADLPQPADQSEEPEAEPPHRDEEVSPNGDTFPREYVEKLREENARYRTRAQTADEAAQRLLAATIASTTTGILADPTDLPAGDYLDGDGWPDPDLIRTAAETLVASKPHLGDRRPRGNIGQGAASEAATVDLAGILRSRA